jgi:hypothetical protein
LAPVGLGMDPFEGLVLFGWFCVIAVEPPEPNAGVVP